MRDVPWDEEGKGWKPLDQMLRDVRAERLREERGTWLAALVLAVVLSLWLLVQLVRCVRFALVAFDGVKQARRGLDQLAAESRDAAAARSEPVPPPESIATESDSDPVEPIARA